MICSKLDQPLNTLITKRCPGCTNQKENNQFWLNNCVLLRNDNLALPADTLDEDLLMFKPSLKSIMTWPQRLSFFRACNEIPLYFTLHNNTCKVAFAFYSHTFITRDFICPIWESVGMRRGFASHFQHLDDLLPPQFYTECFYHISLYFYPDNLLRGRGGISVKNTRLGDNIIFNRNWKIPKLLTNNL